MLTALAVVAALGTVAVWAFLFPFFLRDPDREVASGPGILSPADGRVLYVKRVEAGEIPIAVKNGQRIPIDEFTKIELPEPLKSGWLVGIYLSFWDVHVNRAPIAGRVRLINHHNGKIISMLPLLFNRLRGKDRVGENCDFLVSNERSTIVIDGPFPVIVVAIAAWSVRRIECWVRPEQDLARGDRLGMIRWGSQTDVLFPDLPGLELQVKKGDRVLGGLTTIARLPDARGGLFRMPT